MSTTTTPATTASAGNTGFVNALISIGATLGSAFIKSQPIAQLVLLAATTTETIISSVQAAKAAKATAGTAAPLIVPIFLTVLKAALAAAVAEGKISTEDAKIVSDAIAAVGTEDAIAKTIVDYTTIGPIATV